jgi:multidrug resistance efflux pump
MPFAVDSPATPRSNELRSGEAQEILGNTPPAILQWSNTVFLFIVLALLVLAWFVRYPDVLQAPFRLTSVAAPKAVSSRLTGRLSRLRVFENQPVRAGELVGYLETTARPEEVLALAADLAALRQRLAAGRSTAVGLFGRKAYRQLGELQPAYQLFEQGLLQYESFLDRGFASKKKQIVLRELADLQQLMGILQKQTQLNQQDLLLSANNFAVQRRLHQQKVIPDFDFQQEQSKLLAKQMPVQQAEAAIMNNRSMQSAKQRELLELEKSFAEQNDLFLQTVSTLESAVQGWQSSYLLKAPTTGTIHFATFLEENQLVTANQELFYVSQQPLSQYVEVAIPQQNFGKIKSSQRVWLRFQGYEPTEFGLVEGRVSFISVLPNKDGAFMAKVTLPQGLTTNYQKKLPYKMGMLGTADIITDETRLLERVFYNFRKALAR